MKITICSSAFFVKEANEIKRILEEKGHQVFMYPQEVELNSKIISVEEYYEMRKRNLTKDLLKIKRSLINDHIKKIEDTDAILVLNFDKDGKKGYVGWNTFLEISIAYYLGKKIFIWKNLGEKLPNLEEILPLNPIIIEGDVEKIN